MEWEFHLVFLFPKGKWEQSKEFPARKLNGKNFTENLDIAESR